MLRCSRHFLSTLVFAGTFVSVIGTAHAAELGEARVSSHIGQPLVADIELTAVDDPAHTVSVRLASPEVYNGAGIAMPSVLASLNLSVMRRDGRQFLHVTSLRPVNGEHLHLYLELADKGQRTVRLATLWLTPDPNPAPVPVPLPVAAPVAAPVPAAVVHAEPAPKAAPAPLPPRRPAAVLTSGPAAAPRTLPIRARQAAAPAAPAACTRQAEQASVCAALDGKNAALKAQIGALEWKVKSLQATLGAAPVPSTPAAEAAHEPPGPKPISAIRPLVPRKLKAPAHEPEPASGLPWGWIGGGAALLLALGAALLLARRRAHTRPAPAAAAAAEPAAEAVEPSFE